MLTVCNTEFSNPHAKYTRELLNRLIISDNEFQRANIELRNIQREFKQSIDDVVFQHSALNKWDCVSHERRYNFQQNLENVDIITERFNKNIEKINDRLKKIIHDSRKTFARYNKEKTHLNQFYHKTVNYLKAVAFESNDPEIIRKCEKDVNSASKDFANDILYINKCENILCTFFQLLHEGSVPPLQEHEWQPQGKPIKIVESVAEEIKCCMGMTLKKAFAYLHIQQPLDKETFLCHFLLKEGRNREIIEEKLGQLATK